MTKNIFKSFKIIHNIVRKHGLYSPYYWIFGYFSQKKTTIIAGGYPCTGITQHVLQSMAENSNVPYALNNHKMLKKSKNIDPNLCRNKILNKLKFISAQLRFQFKFGFSYGLIIILNYV